MNTKEINLKKNLQRAIRVTIKVYDCGGTSLGEPSKSHIKTWNFKIFRFKTYRRDYRTFTFVRCRVHEESKILVLTFEPDGINRSSCVLMKSWDPHLTIQS